MNIKSKYSRFNSLRSEFGLWFSLKATLFHSIGSRTMFVNCLTHRLSIAFKDEINRIGEESSEEPVQKPKQIWSMWWQGGDALPDILKICYAAHLKFFSEKENYNYVLITKDNYRQYVDVPEIIEEKLQAGIISFTHFSDLLRVLLLEKYGGVWFDITLLLTKPLDNSVFKHKYYSANLSGYNIAPHNLGQFITNYQWTGFFFATNMAHSPLFVFLKDVLIKYWEQYNYPMDYFMLNLFIRLAYAKNKNIKECINAIPYNNKHLYDMQIVMNNAYDELLLNNLSDETYIYKLTQKQEYISQKESKSTLYQYLKTKYC